MTTLSGGCQCGALRYRISGTLGQAAICHCRMCQKAFGSWGAPLVDVSAENLVWTRGHPATFQSSAIVNRGFCASCGTPMYMHEDGDKNIELAIGTLDDPNAVAEFASQDGVESRVHWFATMHQLPERKTDATRPKHVLEKLKSFQHPDHDTDHWPLRPKQL
jgi:hypothetical protein